MATRHFEQEAARKAQELEAARSKVRSPKKHVAPLPVDYFTKLGEAEAAARAEEKKARAAGQMPAGVKHFTDKKEAATVAEVSEEHMTAAGKHFHRASKAEKEEQAQGNGSQEMMPAAIQYFTCKANQEKLKKKAELEKSAASPQAVPAGIAHFTK